MAQFELSGTETITVSGAAAQRLITSGSGDAALLYLYILSAGGRCDLEDAAMKMQRTNRQINAAMDILLRLGLVSNAQRPRVLERPDELPEYTMSELERAANKVPEFRMLKDEVQRVLGHFLSTNELKTLYGIYDYLGLSPEVILQLVNHCLSEYERRYGTERPVTMRYIEREAFVWEREGIFTLEQAEEYITSLRRRSDAEARVARLLGITGRAASKSETRYISSWCAMGFSDDAIAAAYDRTVLRTGKLSWRYMDTILRSWHDDGLHDMDAIDAAETRKYGPSKTPPAKSGSGPGHGAAENGDRRQSGGKSAVTPEDMRAAEDMLRRINGE